MSNSLDPDQDRHYVGPDLGPNCLQSLSATTKVTASREKVNEKNNFSTINFKTRLEIFKKFSSENAGKMRLIFDNPLI